MNRGVCLNPWVCTYLRLQFLRVWLKLVRFKRCACNFNQHDPTHPRFSCRPRKYLLLCIGTSWKDGSSPMQLGLLLSLSLIQVLQYASSIIDKSISFHFLSCFPESTLLCIYWSWHPEICICLCLTDEIFLPKVWNWISDCAECGSFPTLCIISMDKLTFTWMDDLCMHRVN